MTRNICIDFIVQKNDKQDIEWGTDARQTTFCFSLVTITYLKTTDLCGKKSGILELKVQETGDTGGTIVKVLLCLFDFKNRL